MKFSVSTAIADLVRRAEPELEFRLEAQRNALDENRCINNLVGQWIDTNDVEYLKAVLDLEDGDFAERFPSVGHVGQQRRREMKAEIESHLERCVHCSLAYGYQLELDARIMRAYRENRAGLLQLLDQEDTDVDEGEHLVRKTRTDDSEPHSDPHREPEIIIDPIVEPV